MKKEHKKIIREQGRNNAREQRAKGENEKGAGRKDPAPPQQSLIPVLGDWVYNFNR